MGARSSRVLVLSTSYPSTGRDPSGHFVRSHAQALRASGADVTVIAPGPFAEAASTEEGLSIHRLGGTRLFGWPGAATRVRQNPFDAFDALPFAAKVRARTEGLPAFDRIVAHWMVPTAFPLLTWAGIGRARLSLAELELVAHGADVRLLRALPMRVRARVCAHLEQRASTFTFVARSLRAAFLDLLPSALAQAIADKSRVEACPIAVPPRSHLEDPRPSSGQTERYAVWVGRDVPAKRLELAISAAEAARVPLVVVGASAPTSLGARRRVGGIKFVGPRPREEALAWIAHASVLLSTSGEEAAPTAAREARALGVRVLACRAGDLADWARSDAGISMVEPDVGAIARALVSEAAT